MISYLTSTYAVAPLRTKQSRYLDFAVTHGSWRSILIIIRIESSPTQ